MDMNNDSEPRFDLNARVEQLIRNDTQFKTLMSGLINTSKLAYDKKSLRFDDDFINLFLLAINAPIYEARIEFLNKEEE